MVVFVDIVLIAEIAISVLGTLFGSFLMLFGVNIIADFLHGALIPLTAILFLSVAVLSYGVFSEFFPEPYFCPGRRLIYGCSAVSYLDEYNVGDHSKFFSPGAGCPCFL